jgi:hypothetical protein
VIWLRDLDLNQGPSGYEPDELPGCSTPRWYVFWVVLVFIEDRKTALYALLLGIRAVLLCWRFDRLEDLAATYSPVP